MWSCRPTGGCLNQVLMTDQLRNNRLLSVIERIDQASTTEAVLEIFENAIAEFGAHYFGIHFLPRPEDRLEDVSMAWRVPQEWRDLYSRENFCQIDPAIRHARRTVLPFDWASAPYNPETEPQMGEVIERARDLNVHKSITVPIPSPRGIIGVVGAAGPDFDERDAYKPVVHSIALHAFHRLEQLIGRRLRRNARLTERECEVLAWVSEGKTAWDIGCILSVSQRTVEWHLRKAYKKLGATNRVQALALLANTRSMIDPLI